MRACVRPERVKCGESRGGAIFRVVWCDGDRRRRNRKGIAARSLAAVVSPASTPHSTPQLPQQPAGNSPQQPQQLSSDRMTEEVSTSGHETPIVDVDQRPGKSRFAHFSAAQRRAHGVGRFAPASATCGCCLYRRANPVSWNAPAALSPLATRYLHSAHCSF